MNDTNDESGAAGTVKPAPTIAQIIPAERGWHVAGYDTHCYETRGARGAEPIRWMQEVACWALMSDGTIRPVINDEAGALYPIIADKDPKPYGGLMVYTPTQSYEYRLTRDLEPPEGDWEFCAVSAAANPDADEVWTVWRRPLHHP
jgi:hypothetical protein